MVALQQSENGVNTKNVSESDIFLKVTNSLNLVFAKIAKNTGERIVK